MSKQPRKIVNLNEPQYEILAEYAESKGITLGEAVQEMQKDIDFLKSQTLTTISENAKMFCDQVDALAECGRLPSWLVDAIKITIRPIVLQGMVNKKDIDFAGLRASWKIPEGMRLITCFDKE
jgi:hypothetical protein